MMKSLVCFSFVWLVLSSCQSSAPESQQAASRPDWADTTIQLRINGQSQSYTLKRSTHLNLEDFQSFLDEYANKPLLYSQTQQLDVTGDGVAETIVTEVQPLGPDFKIQVSVRSGEHLLYADTIKPDERYAFDMVWNKDSIYVKLKPYSTFYNALLNLNFTDDLHPGYETQDYWIDHYLEQQAKALPKGMDTLNRKRQIATLKTELQQYKGKLLYRLDPQHRDVYIWDNTQKKFVMFYRQQ